MWMEQHDMTLHLTLKRNSDSESKWLQITAKCYLPWKFTLDYGGNFAYFCENLHKYIFCKNSQTNCAKLVKLHNKIKIIKSSCESHYRQQLQKQIGQAKERDTIKADASFLSRRPSSYKLLNALTLLGLHWFVQKSNMTEFSRVFYRNASLVTWRVKDERNIPLPHEQNVVFTYYTACIYKSCFDEILLMNDNREH